MWINENGMLRQTSDETRVKFRTSLSKEILDQLKQQSEQHGTFVNYLLEDGLKVVLQQDTVLFNKETRPKDRIQYKTTYDKTLLEAIRLMAKEHKLYINDVIEYGVQFIDVERAKAGQHRYRIE
ncbi:rRNA methyltransferase [Sporosarcina sp. A2]|uniref:rRNA methyltransferase n=1 Tax=Sporosarcina sp. A2 TaxID=3393449 RepID=UPI003D79B7C0